MNYILKNEDIEVAFTTLGGTFTSMKDKAGIEYLWQGDKQYWSGQAPILFPICGSIRNDKAMIGKDKVTQMPRHGIVRKQEFQLESQNQKSIEFSIESNEQTKKLFPFEFKFYARYEINGKRITVTYEVQNTGKESFPFLIGGHPGFNCPLFEKESYSDYSIVFEKMEDCDIPTPITETGLIDMEHRIPFLQKQNTLRLNHKLFEKDAIIFDKLKSREVKMVSNLTGRGISLEFKEFPYLIIWSSINSGNFVALEPWMGLSTCSDENDVFEEKRNVQLVGQKESKKYSYEITII